MCLVIVLCALWACVSCLLPTCHLTKRATNFFLFHGEMTSFICYKHGFYNIWRSLFSVFFSLCFFQLRRWWTVPLPFTTRDFISTRFYLQAIMINEKLVLTFAALITALTSVFSVRALAKSQWADSHGISCTFLIAEGNLTPCFCKKN